MCNKFSKILIGYIISFLIGFKLGYYICNIANAYFYLKVHSMLSFIHHLFSL